MSRMLGTICRTAPIDTDLAHYALREPDRPELTRLLQSLEMYKWMEKLELKPQAAPVSPPRRRSAGGGGECRGRRAGGIGA